MNDANHTMCREFEFVTNKKYRTRVFSSKYTGGNKHKSKRLHAFKRYIVALKGAEHKTATYSVVCQQIDDNH
jgi:hypothetical protein